MISAFAGAAVRMRAALALGLLACAPALAAGTMRICTDTNFWYPFTFVKDGRSAGLHVDIVALALRRLDLPAEFRPLPWVRCLRDAEHGAVDGVVSASYQPARAEYLRYPPDAGQPAPSQWRVSQVEYVVVTAAGNPYEYDGKMEHLPQPARAPLGYSVVDDLRKAGVTVEVAPGDESNLRKLVRDGTGVVVTLPEIVRWLLKRPEFTGKLKVAARPITSKSYYFAFSKKASLAPETREKIWNEIARIRDDEKTLELLAAPYAQAAE